MCCSSAGLPVCQKCENVFCQWNEWKRGPLKGVAATNSLWDGKESRPESTCAKIEDSMTFVVHFSVHLSLLCVFSTALFLVNPPPYFCPSLFFCLSHSFFPSFPLLVLSLAHRFLLTLIPFIKHMCVFTIRNAPAARMRNVNTVNALLILNMLV